jgi:AcrR family transcriptional regulator
MPAIKKVSREEIIDAAVELLREGGVASINARSVAKKLGCSTQPIYLSFQNMDELKDAMTQRAIALHTRHVRDSFRSHEDHSSCYSQYSGYSSYGMGFVKFAAQEKYLFRWLYLDGKQFGTYQDDVLLSEIIAAIMTEYGYTEEIAQKVHWDMTYYSYGLAILANTGHLNLTDEELLASFRREFTALAVYYGVSPMSLKLRKQEDL